MKIAVLGAGIIGITSAYELARDGHQVTVFERRVAAAEEASFSNGGITAPGWVAPWAAPGMPGKVLQGFFARHAAIRLGLPLSGQEWRWLWHWSRCCNPERYQTNRANLQRLALYSQQRLHHITNELKLDYESSSGVLLLLRSERDTQLMQAQLPLLRDSGIKFKELKHEEARAVEPALNPDTAFFGALHLPAGEVGNCRQFALLLKNQAQRMGVTFLFSSQVSNIHSGTEISVALAGENSARQFDAIVLCSGLGSSHLLQPLGLPIALAAVHGCSVSAAIREPLNAPQSAVIDARYQVAISRLGKRVRVTGGSEIGGRADDQRTRSVQTLYKVLHDWFPGAQNLAAGTQEWRGARPMLRDGMPLIGTSTQAGIWLNLGHAAHGWALSCGSARLLADLIAGKKPAIESQALGLTRLAG